MAVQYKDGYGCYFLNGVRCPDWLVVTPPEKLDTYKILKEENVEIRREGIRKIGIDRFVQKSGAKVLDKKGEYELLSIDLGLQEKGIALKMKNPSIDTWHIEFVPFGIKSCNTALAWRNGLDIYIEPEQLT